MTSRRRAEAVTLAEGRAERVVVEPVVVGTEHGPAHVRVLRPRGDGAAVRGTVLLGHGAGGGKDAADVLALTGLVEHGWTVALVDQPWRVAGRKVATPPPTLDRAWLQVMDACRGDGAVVDLPRPWVLGGRSAGARVACRTSVDGGAPRTGVVAVVCLAFPLHPPGRPERSRVAELAAPLRAGLPVLVVQGSTDPFGHPDEVLQAVTTELDGDVAGLVLEAVPGAHSPTRDLLAVLRHTLALLDRLDDHHPDVSHDQEPA